MSSFDTSKIFCFITLKVAQGYIEKKPLAELFNEREFCDEFIKSLIYFIDNKKLGLFGFVITSDQIHLIVQSCKDEMISTITELKNRSARDMLHLMGKYLNSMDDQHTRKNIEMRKVFNSYLNGDETVFWQKKTRPIELSNLDEDISPISSDTLNAQLGNKNHNYLHLGASAFTRLMMDTMKI